MGRYSIDHAAVARVPAEAGVDGAVHRLADSILTESRSNISTMGAVDSGTLRNAGQIDGSDSRYTVYYDIAYAPIVHEGEGTSTAKGPRPFLAQAASKQRGRIT